VSEPVIDETPPRATFDIFTAYPTHSCRFSVSLSLIGPTGKIRGRNPESEEKGLRPLRYSAERVPFASEKEAQGRTKNPAG
jgi:hypothetical protein